MKKIHVFIAAGAIICAVLFIVDIYLGAIASVLYAALVMSLFIMQDSQEFPRVTARLAEDAKGIIIENSGNAAAYKIRVALIPLNLEFALDSLAPDAQSYFPAETMVNEAKAVIEFENSRGGRATSTTRLSALDKNDNDLLKPMIPLFSWK
jgi:hypothetical protein